MLYTKFNTRTGLVLESGERSQGEIEQMSVKLNPGEQVVYGEALPAGEAHPLANATPLSARMDTVEKDVRDQKKVKA